MTLATRPLRIRLQTPAGAALAGAKVTLQLSAYQVDGTDIVPLAWDAIEDPAKVGDYVLDVWPNTRGDGGTHYDTLVQANGQVLLRQVVTIPAGAGEALVAAKINPAPWPPLYEAASEVQSARLFSEASGNSAGIALVAKGQVEAVAQQFGDVSAAVEVVTEKREEVGVLTEAAQAASASATEALQTVWALARLASSGAEGVGYSAATTGPDAFFAIRRGGVAMDGVTVLGRTTCMRRTGPGTAQAFTSLLDGGEFDLLFAPLERPDVAYLFGRVGERSAGYVDVLAQWFINTVGVHVGDVVGNSTGVDGPDFKFATTGRPDVALAIVDSAGRGVPIIDSMGRLAGASDAVPVASIPLPLSSDPVLADLLLAGAAYRGQWVAPMACKAWDLVLNAGKFYLFTGASTGALAPGNDAACVEVPLYPRRCYAVDDDFNSTPGAANNRATPQGYAWTTGGAGYLNAVVTGGYMTSQDNTYFRVLGIQGRLVEFESVYECANPVITHTMALSPTNFVNQFEEMWHINWTQDGVGYVTYWHAGLTGQQPVMRLSWGTNKKLQQNVAHKCTVRVRGKVCLGYLDGELAFVHVHDLVETLAANANAIYIQNHTNVLGAEKQHAVRLLVAEGPEFGRIAVNAADSLAPLLVTSDASPEGVVQAPRGSKCFTKAGPEYRKTTAAGMTGWTQIA